MQKFLVHISPTLVLYLWFRSIHLTLQISGQVSIAFQKFSISELLTVFPYESSVVGLTIGYGLDGQGSNPSGHEIFRTYPDGPWGQPSLLYNGYRVFPGVKSGRGVTLTPHPHVVPWSWKSRAIPLLPLWAVWPVQNLSACTRVTFTLLYLSLMRTESPSRVSLD